MPTLEWIGKERVINHHQEIPYRVLNKQYTYNGSISENMVIHGDNLEALKSLLPQFEGRIDVIYIDPPYNTGKEKWIYNDNVNDPRILKWLGEVVGADAEDLSRHDKWLCMMYPRLKLLQKLLSQKGYIFISLDDNEIANLLLILNEIFGSNNFVGIYHWEKTSTAPALSKKIRRKVEYVICYAKNMDTSHQFSQGSIDGGDAPLLNSGNPRRVAIFPVNSVHFKIADGTYNSVKGNKVKLIEPVEVKNGKNNNPLVLEGEFKWVQGTIESEIEEGTYFLVKSKAFSIRYQRVGEKQLKIPQNLIDSSIGVGTNEEAKKELKRYGITNFDYPKPTSLIEFLIKMVNLGNDITVLDSFAGSGTTAHSVMNLNKDKGNRKFILIELMDYAKTITAERLKKAIEMKDVPSNSNFTFYELGEPMFKEDGNLNESIEEDKIREYIFFMETKQRIDAMSDNKYYLGTKDLTDYYFYYEKNKVTNLNYDFLSKLIKKNEVYIIYADKCTIGNDELDKYGIVFKKIPRDISRL